MESRKISLPITIFKDSLFSYAFGFLDFFPEMSFFTKFLVSSESQSTTPLQITGEEFLVAEISTLRPFDLFLLLPPICTRLSEMTSFFWEAPLFNFNFLFFDSISLTWLI